MDITNASCWFVTSASSHITASIQFVSFRHHIYHTQSIKRMCHQRLLSVSCYSTCIHFCSVPTHHSTHGIIVRCMYLLFQSPTSFLNVDLSRTPNKTYLATSVTPHLALHCTSSLLPLISLLFCTRAYHLKIFLRLTHLSALLFKLAI